MKEDELIQERDAVVMRIANYLARKHGVNLADPQEMARILYQVEGLIESSLEFDDDDPEQSADPGLQLMLNEHRKLCESIEEIREAGGTPDT